MSIPTSLKWNKTVYNDQINIQPGSSAHSLKLQVQSLTGVPISRQKLLCPKVWKGPLKDDDKLPDKIIAPKTKGKGALVITLIGSAETLVEKPPDERPLFSEDMTPEELWKATRSGTDKEGDDDDIVDIVALQKEPGMDRDDGKMEMYQYNRLVTGLPQHQINDMLVGRKKEGADHNDSKQSSAPLLGEVALTYGMELRRAYINSLAVLHDGTIVSGLDDGHCQLWRRGQLVKDARHTSARVDHVRTFPPSNTATEPAFVTAGDGTICLWSGEGNHLVQFGCYTGTTPASIAVGSVGGNGTMKYLAACFRVTRQVDPNQFRLVPQNEAERRRREAAEAQEQMIQNELLRVSKIIKLWFYDESQNSSVGRTVMREDIIHSNTLEETAPITKLLDMNGNLVCGDEWGGVRIFEWAQQSLETNNDNFLASRRQCALFQFRGFSIACMAQVREDILAISLQPEQNAGAPHALPSATSIPVTITRGIYIVDTNGATLKAILDAHNDSVQCLCPLPDGGLLSAGGKMDATVRVWDSLAMSKSITDYDAGNSEVKVLTEAKLLKQPGYVFDLQVLPDSRVSPGVYAIAAARYNVVKLII